MCHCEMPAALQESQGAQWWFVSLFGSIVGKLLRAMRSHRSVRPSEPAESVVPESTEMGALLHRLFGANAAKAYEQSLVAAQGFRTVASVRALTFPRYKEACARAKLERGHMVRLRDELRPPDPDAASEFPLFVPY